MPTYHARALVCTKTKLADSDLIYTLLSSEGTQIRAVGKGARKPTSKFSGSLELFNTCDLLLYQGRNLDTISDVKLASANRNLHESVQNVALASTVAELLAKVSRSGQVEPRIFDMACAYFQTMGAREQLATNSLLTVACLFKLCAQIGFRPEFSTCVLCGKPIAESKSSSCASQCDVAGSSRASTGQAYFSMSEGGVVCAECAPHCVVQTVPEGLLGVWRQVLFRSFADLDSGYLAQSRLDGAAIKALFDLTTRWLEAHLGLRLKSLGALASYL
jgi:DNA repair protein RecO (recombination protein O)